MKQTANGVVQSSLPGQGLMSETGNWEEDRLLRGAAGIDSDNVSH